MQRPRKLASGLLLVDIYDDSSCTELWSIFHELDLDRNGHLDAGELAVALNKAGRLFSICIFII
jgi:hypothetical protein